MKHVEPGAHVKIIHGRYVGATGRVVAVTIMDGDHIAAILTDGVNNEIQVNVAYTKISNEVSIGHGNLGGFELFDCVSLSENETAVVINVGLEKLRVINHMNTVKEVYPQDIVNKRNSQSSKQVRLYVYMFICLYVYMFIVLGLRGYFSILVQCVLFHSWGVLH